MHFGIINAWTRTTGFVVNHKLSLTLNVRNSNFLDDIVPSSIALVRSMRYQELYTSINIIYSLNSCTTSPLFYIRVSYVTFSAMFLIYFAQKMCVYVGKVMI